MKLRFKSEDHEADHYIALIRHFRNITLESPFNYRWNYISLEIDQLYRNGKDVEIMFDDIVNIPVAQKIVENSYFVNEVAPWDIVLSIKDTPFIEMVQIHTDVDQVLNDPYYVKRLCNILLRTKDPDELYDKWIKAVYVYRKTTHSIKLDELDIDGMTRYMNKLAINYHILNTLNRIKERPTIEDGIEYLKELGLSPNGVYKLRRLL